MRRYLYILAVAAGVAAAPPAAAALPPSAYDGPLWDRVKGGLNCMVGSFSNTKTLVLPRAFGQFEPMGVYWYYDARRRTCVRGGAPFGPQF